MILRGHIRGIWPIPPDSCKTDFHVCVEVLTHSLVCLFSGVLWRNGLSSWVTLLIGVPANWPCVQADVRVWILVISCSLLWENWRVDYASAHYSNPNKEPFVFDSVSWHSLDSRGTANMDYATHIYAVYYHQNGVKMKWMGGPTDSLRLYYNTDSHSKFVDILVSLFSLSFAKPQKITTNTCKGVEIFARCSFSICCLKVYCFHTVPGKNHPYCTRDWYQCWHPLVESVVCIIFSGNSLLSI